MPSAMSNVPEVIDLTDELLPSYESVTGDRSPFYATGNAGVSPRPVADERLHMPKLPLHGNISTLLIRRPWGEANAPTQIIRLENGSSTRNSSCESFGRPLASRPGSRGSPVAETLRGGSTVAEAARSSERLSRPPLAFSSSPTSSRSSSSYPSPLSPSSYTCTPENSSNSDCIISTPEDPCIASINYPKTRLASTVKITVGSPLPFDMKMKKVDFGTRSHEFTSPDGRTYVWRYDMLVGSSMSLYCTSGGLTHKGIKVATMERAVSMIESLVRSDRKLRVDTDWVNEEVALVTALVMLKKEKDRKQGVSN